MEWKLTVPMTVREALEMAKEKKYDIILDLMLPKMDGFEVCQQIREFSKCSHCNAYSQGRRHGQDPWS